ncbi:hypothetical protein [Nostoc sp. PA-18-2419]|uniref:hypothetical protein n=1 Tax=Nostoc sp. PA-18-2419 TaxID=2575443 RepID=UPI001107D1ED|nr:hypothetical protein [Nostoc sp. PA-18-2419]
MKNEIINLLVSSLKKRKTLFLEAEILQHTEHYELPNYIVKFWDDVDPQTASNEQLLRLEVYLRQVHQMDIQGAYKLIHTTRRIANEYNLRIDEVYRNGK